MKAGPTKSPFSASTPDQPFERKGRIADHTTAMNIFDAAKPDPMQLDAERAEMWDMLAAASARAEAERARRELDQARSQAAELQAQVAALNERLGQFERHASEMEARAARAEAARTLAERELGAIKSSVVWRFLSPVLRLSRR